ncbi:MAG TPA: RICIN domain-containing protein [Streptosporangiaceae bacterium]|nr:RICIN domain-containing protein [Streptosporangiaceae bacterium]
MAVTALVAAGGVGMGLALVANAQTTITSCPSTTSAPISCTITDAVDTTVSEPSTIEAVVTLNGSSSTTTTTSDLYIELQYSVQCFDSSGNIYPSSQPTDDEYAITSSLTEDLTLGLTNPYSCEVLSLEGTLETYNGTSYVNATTGSFTMDLEWTPQATATSTTTTSSSVDVAYISGYGGKCIDDRGNSSSNGAEVIIWGCNHGDSAQGWTWTDYELRHNGMCANDPGYGGSGSKLILYSCTGSSNEKWSHVAYGEFKLYYSAKGSLCLDDPGYSKTNGTRLMVYKCNNGSNQHWSRS